MHAEEEDRLPKPSRPNSPSNKKPLAEYNLQLNMTEVIDITKLAPGEAETETLICISDTSFGPIVTFLVAIW